MAELESIYNRLMSWLEISLLGPPEIRLEGSLVKTDRRKAIALLAYLAVTGKPQTRDFLSAFLWPDYERDSAYAYLRRTLWELNQMLGKGWIQVDRDYASLAPTGELWLDVAAFQRLIKDSRSGIEGLTEAINLYRGDFLAGFAVADTGPLEDWQMQQAEHFRRQFAECLERLVGAHARAGEYETGLGYAWRWLAQDQLNEAAHRAIMRLLAGMGDRTGAVRQYEACVQILKTELGVDPQPETTVLYESVLHGGVHTSPPEQDGKSTSAIPGLSHLPLLPTPFIGRRPDVDRLKALMKDADVRLLTLTGPGGAGKTRLSIQAASELEEAFPDGVFFAVLAPVQTELGAIQTIARVIGFPFLRDEESPRQQLLDFLCEKQLLLILDNFEHLIEAVGLVRDILAAATGVKLVITSRVRLNLQGEQLYPVGGMSLPDAFEVSGWDTPIEQAESFSGVQLFIDRARRVQPEFTLTRENLTSVLEIGRLVQGMPLGLELAAAWVELLPPEEIKLEISHNLDFLDTDLADIPDRQRSIRAVFESSWGLLTDEERETFLRLCVFVGSFSREAALKVSGASLRSLLGLANKSWLQQTSGGRFQLHELMRQYGDERLQMDIPAWREAKNRHAEYFARFVESQSQKMRSADQIAGFRALGEEYEGNIRVAGDWLVAERRWDDLIDRMGLGMFHFDWIRWGLHELIPWFRTARLSLGSETGHE
ncbi:MAG TPA: BTAD domain-containing putative transcriptional regulator, partial [Anaerolineales bacterium]|nr:BTAD domain-containing putative transcriptional regulator [Anaerolineales bacterium]